MTVEDVFQKYNVDGVSFFGNSDENYAIVLDIRLDDKKSLCCIYKKLADGTIWERIVIYVPEKKDLFGTVGDVFAEYDFLPLEEIPDIGLDVLMNYVLVKLKSYMVEFPKIERIVDNLVFSEKDEE